MSSTKHIHLGRILRSPRSRKNLKLDHGCSRPRRPSDCSDTSRDSSSSYGSSRSPQLSSIGCDPLRAHPPMFTSRAAFDAYKYIPGYGYDDDDAEDAQHANDDQHAQMRAVKSPRNVKARNAWAFQDAAAPVVRIYDGFDFGFEPTSVPPVDANTTSRQQPPPLLSTSSPSRSSSYSDSSSPSSPSTDSNPVTPRPHVGMDDADYFMKRGDWKRRGIVFSGAEAVEEPEANYFGFATPI